MPDDKLTPEPVRQRIAEIEARLAEIEAHDRADNAAISAAHSSINERQTELDRLEIEFRAIAMVMRAYEEMETIPVASAVMPEVIDLDAPDATIPVAPQKAQHHRSVSSKPTTRSSQVTGELAAHGPMRTSELNRRLGFKSSPYLNKLKHEGAVVNQNGVWALDR
jgi:multidrug resistance efflux pump